MQQLFTILLFIHIFFGCVGLLTGTLNSIRKKGTKPHFLVGKIFVVSMLINAVAGFIMSVMHSIPFLLIIAVFSFYMVGTGHRILSLKNTATQGKPLAVDYFLSYLMLFFGTSFVAYGSYIVYHKNSFGIVLLVFGIISLLMVRSDFKIYAGRSKYKNYWLLIHLQRMVGAYIAAVTAFLVTNDYFKLGVILWLLPTVILTPLIFRWSRQKAVKVTAV